MKYLVLAAALAFVLSIPFVLRDEVPVVEGYDATVVVITPHTESIRHEFARGFAEYYLERTGKTVYVDYRTIGGTSEIVKYVRSEYTNAFRNHWVKELGREWTVSVENAFMDARVAPGDNPEFDTPEEAARRAFLASEVSCGIDVFFGGGTYDYSSQASAGTLVPSDLLRSHADWFTEQAPPGVIPEAIPQTVAGERYYDNEGRWFGAVLSSYGIIFNRHALKGIGVEKEPDQWSDLTDGRYFGQIAVCDPTKSGSMTQAFEMILQQQMQSRLRELRRDLPNSSDETLEPVAVRDGWERGMRNIQIISANARYFSDSSQKPNIDVATGNCAAGMSIDFYGRFQQQNILERTGDNRFGFNTPEGGTTISADPIGMFRGAPHRELAEAFIEYVMSMEGQKLWNFRVGAPGGPETYALRRAPIRPELYREPHNSYRSDPDFIPYLETERFQYRSDWTGRLFSEIRTIIRICFIDPREELVAAWGAILQARAEGRHQDANEAYAVFSDLSRISYDEAASTIDAALKAPRIEEVRLARELSGHLREQYERARHIAEGK